MKVGRAGPWLLAVVLCVVAGGAILTFLPRDQPPIAVKTTDDLTYVAYRPPVVNDAVAYRGTLSVGSDGCIVFTVVEPAGSYFAAFPEGTEVTSGGVRSSPGTFYAFGDQIVVGREYDPYFDKLDTRGLARCDKTLVVFGLGLQ